MIVAVFHRRLFSGNTLRDVDVGTVQQWAEAGTSLGRLRTKVRHGELVRRRHGVYVTAAAIAAAGDDPARRHALDVRAVLASLPGTGAVASHESAAILHELPVLQAPPEGSVSLIRLPAEHQGRSAAGVRYYSARLPAAHATRRHGVRVTTAARTVIDLARTRPFMDGVVAADAAIRMLKANRPGLLGIIKDCTRSPGLDAARRVVDFSNGLSGSPLESCARVVFDAYGLPPPELQATVHAGYNGRGRGMSDDGRLLYVSEYHDYVVDFLWRDRKTIAETDGKLKYKSGLDAIRQAKRDTLLQEQGYRVVHITWDDLFRHPQLVVKRILDAFTASLPAKRIKNRAETALFAT